MIGVTPDAESAARVSCAVERVRSALAPWQARTSYLNFTEMARPDGELFDAATLRKLRRVKAANDPVGIIKANYDVRGTNE